MPCVVAPVFEPPTWSPPGAELQPKTGVLKILVAFSAPEPGLGLPVAGLQLMRIAPRVGATVGGKFQPFVVKVISSLVSPKLGARNDSPQPPRSVRCSFTRQLNATLGL